MAVRQLIYVSHSMEFGNENELDKLLSQSRENNERLSVTGMLLYHDNIFFQVLEGDKDVVQRIYEKIDSDPRHDTCRIMCDRVIASPDSLDWSMAYQKTEGKLLKGFNTFMLPETQSSAIQSEKQSIRILTLFRDHSLKE